MSVAVVAGIGPRATKTAAPAGGSLGGDIVGETSSSGLPFESWYFLEAPAFQPRAAIREHGNDVARLDHHVAFPVARATTVALTDAGIGCVADSAGAYEGVAAVGEGFCVAGAVESGGGRGGARGLRRRPHEKRCHA
jgi:hypothetical protein